VRDLVVVVCVGMSSAAEACEVKGLSSHQRDAAVRNKTLHQPQTEFRMVPSEADCQVELTL